MRRLCPRMGVTTSMLLSLCALTAIGLYAHGISALLPQVLIAAATASFLDAAVRFARTRQRICPTSALISGLIIALIMPVHQPWYIPVVAASLAMGSKHVLRMKGKNLFNPAALSVAACTFIFPEPFHLDHPKYLEAGPSMYFAQSYLRLNDWTFLLLGGHCWAASTSALAVMILGAMLLYKLRRVEQVTTFLATYILAFAIFACVAGQDIILRLLLEVFPSGVLFFSLFMLADPPTSPRARRGRALYGSLVAVLGFLLRFLASPVQFLLLALVTANLLVAALERAARGL